VFGLQPGYKRILAQYPDMSTFQDVTMEVIFERINRGIRMGQDPFSGSASGAGQRTSKSAEKSAEHRVSNNSKPDFKKQSKRERFKAKAKPLTEEQKRRAELLIQRGSGEFVGMELYENSNWWDIAKSKDVCARCAKSAHIAKDCALPNPRKKKSGKNHFNAIKVGSGMDIDFEYFCSLSEGTAPLAMFPCLIRGKRDITLLDTGASRNYIS